MITEQDIVRVTNEQEVYEGTLEATVSRLERKNRELRGRIMSLERVLDKIDALVRVGIDQ